MSPWLLTASSVIKSHLRTQSSLSSRCWTRTNGLLPLNQCSPCGADPPASTQAISPSRLTSHPSGNSGCCALSGLGGFGWAVFPGRCPGLVNGAPAGRADCRLAVVPGRCPDPRAVPCPGRWPGLVNGAPAGLLGSWLAGVAGRWPGPRALPWAGELRPFGGWGLGCVWDLGFGICFGFRVSGFGFLPCLQRRVVQARKGEGQLVAPRRCSFAFWRFHTQIQFPPLLTAPKAQ